MVYHRVPRSKGYGEFLLVRISVHPNHFLCPIWFHTKNNWSPLLSQISKTYFPEIPWPTVELSQAQFIYAHSIECYVTFSNKAYWVLAKMSEDLYYGTDTPNQPLDNFRSVLVALNRRNLKLYVPITIIGPRKTTIFKWIWQQGNFQS